MTLTDEELIALWAGADEIRSSTFIRYAENAYNLSFEAARNLVYQLMEEGRIMLTGSYSLRRVQF